MKEYIMCLDLGTTGVRCVFFDKAGNIVSMVKEKFKQIYPEQGQVEHDPEQIWQVQLKVCKDALKKAGVSAEDVAAIGITNQRETVVVWDKDTGRPVYNAIVWQDRRTADRINEADIRGAAGIIRKKTGLRPDSYFSASKIEWILKNITGAREAAEKGRLLAGTIDTWIIWKLTGGRQHVTDYTNASRTMLFDIDRLEWDKDLLSLFDIPKEMLPEVRPSSGEFGVTDCSVFGCEIPVTGVAGDQQSSLFGHGCFEPADIKNTYGTGCFLLMNTGKERSESGHGLLTTLTAGTKPGSPEYALEGSVYYAGALVEWLCSGIGLFDSPEEMERFAGSAEDTEGVYIVPAFIGLGAPYWDSSARGLITGLTGGAGREQIARAALEAIAFQTLDVLRAMEQDICKCVTHLRSDGGVGVNDILMQFQADIAGIPVTRAACPESTALGAAFLAGLECGFWKDKEEVKGLIKDGDTFCPEMGAEDVQTKTKEWKKAVEKAVI